ncbi:MAG: prephenate dehydrogenase [Gammaproteobacteria bacterium]
MVTHESIREVSRSVCIEHLGLIGVGLIGGSLARALRQAGAVSHITGFSINLPELKKAVELGVIDAYAKNAAETVAGADMVVVAVPLGAMGSVFAEISPALANETVVTDVGSVKRCVIQDARANLGRHWTRFVPAHPVAGTERSGVAASFAQLFDRHRVVLTPLADTELGAVQRVAAMWESAGAVVECMSVDDHDLILAASSHLPHVLAYVLVQTLATQARCDDIFRLAAGGFADFTRIASSDPRMWHEIVLANRDAILTITERFGENVEALLSALRSGDGEGITKVFGNAKKVRDEFEAHRRKRHLGSSAPIPEAHP